MAGLIAATRARLDPGPTATLATAAGAAATLVSGASETLAEPASWARVLARDLWPDADPAWLAAARGWGQMSSTPS